MFIIIALLIPGVNYLFQLTANYVYDKVHMPEVLRINIIKNNINEVEEDEIVDISDDTSLQYRNYYNGVGIAIIKEYPIFGVGLNNYSYLYNNQNALDYLEDKTVIDENSKYMYPHNGFVQMASEIGIVGTLLFFVYLIYVYYLTMKNADIKYKYFTSTVLLLFILGNFTESLIYNKQYMYLFVILYSFINNKSLYIEGKKKRRR